MKIWETLEQKKKWLYLFIALLVVGAGGAATAKIILRTNEAKYAQLNPQLSNPVYADLLYLGNNPNLKITADQAKKFFLSSSRYQRLTRQRGKIYHVKYTLN